MVVDFMAVESSYCNDTYLYWEPSSWDRDDIQTTQSNYFKKIINGTHM